MTYFDIVHGVYAAVKQVTKSDYAAKRAAAAVHSVATQLPDRESAAELLSDYVSFHLDTFVSSLSRDFHRESQDLVEAIDRLAERNFDLATRIRDFYDIVSEIENTRCENSQSRH